MKNTAMIIIVNFLDSNTDVSNPREETGQTWRKDRLNPEKGATIAGERWHLSLKFSREFWSLDRVKSQFSLSKVRLYCL